MSCNTTVNAERYTNLDTSKLQLDGEFNQTGGSSGFYLGVENELIGGQAEVVGYNNQPEIVDGKVVESNIDQLCDGAAMKGGRRKSKSRRNKSRRNKSRRNIKSKSKRNKSRRMRGGMSPLTDAFNGDVVNHDVNMTNREFNCAQPAWEPKCI